MIGAISRGDRGLLFSIERAGIAAVEYLSKGVKLLLTDSTGEIDLVVWQDLIEALPDRIYLAPGCQVRVLGEIDEYEGELEIIPTDSASVVLLNRGCRLPVESRAVHDVTPSDEGRILVVEGRVVQVEGSRWQTVWLDDGSGRIAIYVPQRVVPYLPPGIAPGAWLTVTGEVEVYKGTLEIIPQAGADVSVR